MTQYPTVKLNVNLRDDEALDDIVEKHERNRNILRERALKEFLMERPGTGTKELAANYRYDVETLANGDCVFVTRPVALNKGFDFIIHVTNHVFSNNRDYPRHDDIFNDIRNKIEFVEDKLKDNLRKDLYTIFEKVYFCVNTDLILENFKLSDESFNKLPGFSLEMLIKVIKWFFIEQDIRYWNWSGRKKFWDSLVEIVGKPTK
ncbi:MAG: DNA adenine methylase [Candidatus Moranbacteria bacterium]|nr:DNA adenine methylase [Candidatus Moranbacteria bacterium]